MSGRGVITSRTTVSVKSTTDCRSSRPSSSEISPSSLAVSGCRAAGGVVPLPLAVSRSRRLPRIWSSAAVSGVMSRASGLNTGSRKSSTRSGSAPTTAIGIRCSQTTTNATSDTTNVATERRLLMSLTRAISTAASTVHKPIATRTGMKRRGGSSRYSPSSSSRPPRSAMRRSERRISAANAACTVPRNTVAQATRKSASGVMECGSGSAR